MIDLKTTSPDCYSVYWNNNPTDWTILKVFGSGNPSLFGFCKWASSGKPGIRLRAVGNLQKCKEELSKILAEELK